MPMFRMPYTLTRGDEEIEGRLDFTPYPAERATRWYPGADAYAEILGFTADDGREIELTDAEASDRDLEAECLRYADEMCAGAREDAADMEMELRRERRLGL